MNSLKNPSEVDTLKKTNCIKFCDFIFFLKIIVGTICNQNLVFHIDERPFISCTLIIKKRIIFKKTSQTILILKFPFTLDKFNKN